MVKMIIGLGNPGEKYSKTRHNVGFMLVDRLVKQFGEKVTENKVFKAEIATVFIDGEKIYLVKPTTFMNKSGEAVHALMTYYGLETSDLLIVYDDLDMAIGKVRFRQKGSAGGHNGVKSIIKHLGTQEFERIKIGIGRPAPNIPVHHYVLSQFEKEDTAKIEETLSIVDKAVNFYLQEKNFKQMMQKFSR